MSVSSTAYFFFIFLVKEIFGNATLCVCRGEKAGDPGTEEDGELVEDSTQYDIEKLQVHIHRESILISE